MAVGTVLLVCPAARHGIVIGAAPADVEARDDATPQATVGGLYGINGKLYMYVKFDNGTAVAAVAGKAAYIADTTWAPHNGVALVTSDVSAALGVDANAICVGVFVNAITDLQYGFIQVGGVKTGVLSNADAAGQRLIVSSTDGSLAKATAGGDIVEFVAISYAAAA